MSARVRSMVAVAMTSSFGCGAAGTLATPGPPSAADASAIEAALPPEVTADAGAIAIPDGPPSFTLPFHDGTVLRVYGAPKKEPDGPFWNFEFDSRITLARFDPRSSDVKLLGRIGVQHGSNYGALFVPIGITGDDAYIVLRARMGSPGAGGGAVDLGYGSIPVAGSGEREVEVLATASAVFFDGFDVAVFVDRGASSCKSPFPNTFNDAVVRVRRVGRDKPTVALGEQPDTTYAILSSEPRSHTVTYEAKHFTYSASCPRDADPCTRADDQTCAKSTAKRGTLHIP